MQKIILFSFLALFLVSCSSTQLLLHKDQITITLNDKVLLEAQGSIINEKTLIIPHIKIYQTVYKFNNIISYEYAKVEVGYRFNYNVPKTVDLVFAKYASKIIYSKGDFTFFKLHSKLKDESIYMLVENENKKSMKFIYGFSYAVFNELIDSIKNNRPYIKINTNNSNEQSEEDWQQYIKSSWGIKNIILDQLIIPAAKGVRIKK